MSQSAVHLKPLNWQTFTRASLKCNRRGLNALSSHSRVSSPWSFFLLLLQAAVWFLAVRGAHISCSSLTHSLALSLAHGHRSVRDSHGEVEKRLFSLLFLNSEIRIDDTIHISPHTTLFPMRSETESRFSQVQYGALFSSSWLGCNGGLR